MISLSRVRMKNGECWTARIHIHFPHFTCPKWKRECFSVYIFSVSCYAVELLSRLYQMRNNITLKGYSVHTSTSPPPTMHRQNIDEKCLAQYFKNIHVYILSRLSMHKHISGTVDVDGIVEEVHNIHQIILFYISSLFVHKSNWFAELQQLAEKCDANIANIILFNVRAPVFFFRLLSKRAKKCIIKCEEYKMHTCNVCRYTTISVWACVCQSLE